MSNQNYTAYTHLTFAQATYPFAYGDGPPLMVCNPRLSVVSIGGGATIRKKKLVVFGFCF